MGFTKLDERILKSSVMSEDSDTFKVWIALLASCEEDGIAEVSSTYLSGICFLPMDTVDRCLEKLEAPDPRSRSLNDEGRRIRRVDGGFLVINYLVYRSLSLKSAQAERMRLYRKEKGALSDVVTNDNDVMKCSHASASASSSSDSEEGEEKEEGSRMSVPANDGQKSRDTIEFDHQTKTWKGMTGEDIAGWAEAYPACDVGVELKRMREWILGAGPQGQKRAWRRFITGWLKRTQADGGTKNGRPPAVDSRVGASMKRDHNDDYWVEVRRLKALGFFGDELTAELEKWKKGAK